MKRKLASIMVLVLMVTGSLMVLVLMATRRIIN